MMSTLAGCDALFGLDPLSPASGRDAASDGTTIDAPCLGTGMLTGLCIESSPGLLVLGGGIDTDTQPCRAIAQNDHADLCVLEAVSIQVVAYAPVTGKRPLVLLAAKEIEIDAPLDASSKHGARIGAGAQTTCAGGQGTNGVTGAGGGAGGTFGWLGGPGGVGEATTATPRLGGSPTSVVPQTAVYGGCGGGDGGVVSGAVAVGGAGGGAIYAIAGERIHVTDRGMINASGAGGAAGLARNGGGGGGSGGFIALDAPEVVLDGPVFARGGGGGGGGGLTDGGQPGEDPTGALGQTHGGAPGTSGSAGGDGCGAPEGQVGGIVSTATYGAGGGGGACGRIRIYGTRTGTGTVNPAPS